MNSLPRKVISIILVLCVITSTTAVYALANEENQLTLVTTNEYLPVSELNPTPTADPSPALMEESIPTSTAEPTPAPTAEPTPTPTAEPTPDPTAEPTPAPTAEPTPAPTAEPTPAPTVEPTPAPTVEPTPAPTAEIYSMAIFAEDSCNRIHVGQQLQLYASVEPSVENAPTFWSSSDETVASVDGNGLVTGKSSGNAVIFAVIGDIKSQYHLEVAITETKSKSVKAVSIDSGKCGDNLEWVLNKNGELIISGTGAMSDYDYNTYPWYSYAGIIKSIIIESGVKNIGAFAFYNCNNVSSVSIADSVKIIGANAFGFCTSLNCIQLPKTLEVIGNGAFSNCISLKEIVVPEGLSSIAEHTFAYCLSLTQIAIPNSVTSFGEGAFYECSSLPEISISENVTSIGSYAFVKCNSLTSIFIPKNVVEIGSGVFSRCNNLYSISVAQENIYYCAVDGALFSKDLSILISYPAAKNGNYELPAQVKIIGESAFEGSAITGIIIPRSVTVININAFYNCPFLTKIAFEHYPSDTLTIGENAFYSTQSALSTEVVVSDMQSIPYSISTYNWQGSNRSAFFTSASDGLSGVCGPNAIWRIDEDGVLIISGYGEMFDYSTSTPPWTNAKKVIIESGVTTIGANAFMACSNLTRIEIPDSVRSIGHQAFFAPNLSEINVDKNNQFFVSEEGVLFNKDKTKLLFCPPIKNGTYYVPNGVTSIESQAFWCSTLSEVIISESVLNIADSAFFMCGKLLNVVIPDSVMYIGNAAFVWGQFETLQIGKNVLSIGERAFTGSSKLNALVIKSGTVNIGKQAFSNCANLREIIFKSTSPTFASDTFENVSAVAYYPANDPTWEETIKCTYGGNITWKANEAIEGIFNGSAAEVDSFGNLLIRTTNFPDDAFRSYVSSTFDTSGNGYLTAEQVEEIKSIKLTSESIYSLLGVEYFTSLTELSCDSLLLSELDVSKNTVLTTLVCRNNQLEELDLSGNLKLKEVIVDCNHLSTLIISNNSELTKLICSNNKLAELNVANLINLTEFQCSNNDLLALDVSNNSELVLLSCAWNNLSSLDVSQNTKLESLYCDMNGLKELTFGENSCLEIIRCENNCLSGMDLSTVTSLAYLNCSNNNLPVLDLSENYNLIDGEVPSCVTTFSPQVIKLDAKLMEGIYVVDMKELVGADNIGRIVVSKGGAYDATTGIVKLDAITGEIKTVSLNYTYDPNTDRSVCALEVYAEVSIPKGYSVSLPNAGLNADDTIYINGVAYTSDELGTVYLDNTNAKIATVYAYNEADGSDLHSMYPTGLKVWLLEYEDGSYVSKYIGDLDNCLQYSGSSIRITGNKGIRMITSVPTSLKEQLISNGLGGYKLVEYGTVVAWASELNGSELTLEHPASKSNYAYKKGVSDPIFANVDGLTQYTNVLVGFTNEQCIPDLVMRPYMALQSDEGNTVIIYGGAVQRSIGYIAWQNRAAFSPGSAAYEYIWDIIHYVYGDLYDSEYKK